MPTVTLGPIEATPLTNQLVEVHLHDLGTILTIERMKDTWTPVAYQYKDEERKFDCPTCKKSHWNDDSMLCQKNKSTMQDVTQTLMTFEPFKTWLASL
jgi:hypothetical protein